ncbi:MAG: thiamine-phosphate kinase [Burkholderiales bacterium]|nr:thiamine-phosphate kinase [Burkholderiales bacterium]
MALGEFDLIRRFFTRETPSAVLGVGDDAALLAPTPGMQLAVAADTMVEGRHFFAGTDPFAVGWKSLAVNLSDMAAMGAVPRWITLCLTLPRVDEAWLAGFADGLLSLALREGVELIGGDTTSGPLAISIQILGEVPPGQALQRDGAQAGDDIWLSGEVGAAALAVRHRMGQLALDAAALAHCSRRLDLPEPRLALGLALRGLATAAIDVSDGLVADVGHIAARSGLRAVLQLDALPPLHAVTGVADTIYQAAQLSGGDDYELCFTAPVAARGHLGAMARSLGLPLARIGTFTVGEGVAVLNSAGEQVTLARPGFDHFN